MFEKENMKNQETLFELPKLPEPKETKDNFGKRRIKSPVRNQTVIEFSSLDDLIPQDHKVRSIWEYVQKLDLSKIIKKIKVVEGGAGRPAIDPNILLSLWIYAIVEGIISARVIERYCSEHIAFKWLCGGVSVNYHTISDFRTNHKDELDELFTQSVAILMKQGVVDLKRIAQDGTKVRANAGSSSFRREKKLEECLKEAKEHLSELLKEIEEDPSKHLNRINARKKRTIIERKNKAEEAVEELKKLRKEIEENKARYTKKEVKEKIEKARVSKTDPEARKMKMGNGGFSPAYNVQFATDTKSQAIVGVDVINAGYDYGQITPMMNQVLNRFKTNTKEWLADPGYRKKEDIENAAELNKDCEVYIPLMESKNNPPSDESSVVKKWRERMEKDEAKVIYRERASTAECVNALAKNRGLLNFLVRGLQKVQCVALLFAITHNVLRGIRLIGV